MTEKERYDFKSKAHIKIVLSQQKLMFYVFIWFVRVVVILVIILSLSPSLSQVLTSLIPDVSLPITFPVPSRVPGIKQFLH